jgi:hypothetical protein
MLVVSRARLSVVITGGIQTLLTAEKGLGARAFIAFAPAAQSWGNGTLDQILKYAVEHAKAPAFILQAKNDYSTQPTEVLGRIAKSHGGQAKIYPGFGKAAQEAHWAFATTSAGISVWDKDVLQFYRISIPLNISIQTPVLFNELEERIERHARLASESVSPGLAVGKR